MMKQQPTITLPLLNWSLNHIYELNVSVFDRLNSKKPKKPI